MLTLEDFRNRNYNDYLIEAWGLDAKAVARAEEAVLDRLYNMMSLKEQKMIDEGKVQLNEFLGALLRWVAPTLLGYGASKLMKSGEKLISAEDREEMERASKPGILGSLWGLIKKVGIIVLIAAIFYLGFRSETIRAAFPFLAPIADKIGHIMKITGSWAGSNILWPAFKKIAQVSKELAMWLIKKAFEYTGVTKALERAYKYLEELYGDIYKTLDAGGKKVADAIKGGARAVRDAGSAMKDKIDAPLEAIKDKLREPGGNPAAYNKHSRDPFGNINTKSPFPSTSQSEKDLDFLNSGKLRDFGKGGSGAFTPSGSKDIDAIKRALGR
jgi:hypothetical protein